MALTYLECVEDDAALVYTCDPCEKTEGGGIRSFMAIRSGITIAVPLNLTALTAQVESGDVIILPATRGTYDGGTPKMVAGFGSQKERRTGADYVLQVKAPTYAENAGFMEALEKTDKWNLAFATETQLHIVTDDCNFTTKAPIEEGIDTDVLWNIEAKWFSKTKPTVTPISPIVTLLKCFEITA
jgi:hypothetical protein